MVPEVMASRCGVVVQELTIEMAAHNADLQVFAPAATEIEWEASELRCVTIVFDFDRRQPIT